MTSVTGKGQGHLSGVASTAAFDREVDQPETSKVGENTSRSSADSGSGKRQKLLNVEQETGVADRPAERRLIAGTETSPRASFSAPSAERGAENVTTESARKQGKEAGASARAGKVAGGVGMELAPPRSSRSRDRRQSMSLIEAVFRRRRRPSASDRVQIDNEAPTTTAGPSTWRSEVCRQLNDEAAATSSTVERDEVDRHPRPLGGSWQQKFRRRFCDISSFSRPTPAGKNRSVVHDIFQ